MMSFNDNAAQFQCCFGSLHIRVGAFIVGFLDLLLILLKVLVALGLCLTTPYSWPLVITAVYSIFGLFSMLMFFKGMRFRKPSFVLQYLAVLSIGICLSVFLVAFSIFTLYLLDEMYREKYQEIRQRVRLISEDEAKESAARMVRFSTFLAVLSLTVCLAAAFVETWFFVIASNAYSYIVQRRKVEQLERHRDSERQMVQKVRFQDEPRPAPKKASGNLCTISEEASPEEH